MPGFCRSGHIIKNTISGINIVHRVVDIHRIALKENSLFGKQRWISDKEKNEVTNSKYFLLSSCKFHVVSHDYFLGDLLCHSATNKTMSGLWGNYMWQL